MSFQRSPACRSPEIAVNLPPLSQRIAAGLADASADQARRRAFESILPRLPPLRERYPELQQRIRAIEADAVEDLDALVERAAEQLRLNEMWTGGTLLAARPNPDSPARTTSRWRRPTAWWRRYWMPRRSPADA